MEKRKGRIAFFSALLIVLCFCAQNSYACTGITLKAKDGSLVFGRTMEFGHQMASDVIVVPRDYEFTGFTTSGKNGLQWKSKFAAVGANFDNTPVIIDGLNEKGLTCNMLYFPGYADYQKITKSDNPITIAPWQIGTWILTQFETVSEIKENLPKIRVANVIFKKWNMIVPLHAIVTDISGKSIVIEYVKGQLNIHDNDYGVLTNSPPFDWMTTNIRNYLHLSPNNIPGETLAGNKLTPFGEGSGMLGAPGDFTPPSRFIRALFFSLASLTKDNAKETVQQAFHILNNFDIPQGVIRSVEGKEKVADYTQWTTVGDLSNRNFYYKTEGNSRIRVVQLMKCNLDADDIIKLPMESAEDILDVTADLK